MPIKGGGQKIFPCSAPRWCSGPTSPPRWSSSHSMCTASAFFLALLAELYPYPSVILQQLPELDQLWDWSYPDSGLVSWTETPHLCQTLSQSFSVPGLSFLCLSTSTLSIGFVIWSLFPFLPVRYFHVINGGQNQACIGHVSSVDLNKTIKDGGITVGFWIIKVMTPIWNYLLSFVHLGIITDDSSVPLNHQSPYRHLK